MAPLAFIGVRLFVDGYDIAGDFSDLALNYGSESLDATTFGQTTRVHQGGLRIASLSGKGYLNLGTCTSDQVLFSNIGGPIVLATVFPTTIVENATSTSAGYAGNGYAMTALDAKFNIGGQVGPLMGMDVDLQSASDLVRAIVLKDFSTIATTSGVTNTSPFTKMAAATSEQIYAGLHVTFITTSSGVISATVQAASSSGFGSTSTRFSFTAMSCRGAQAAVPVPPSALSTDQIFWRGVITSCGGGANGIIWIGLGNRYL